MNIKKQICQHKLELDALIYAYNEARTPLTQETLNVIIRGLLVEVARLQRIESKRAPEKLKKILPYIRFRKRAKVPCEKALN
jgi:hypothetical protein